jgi:hypothetical protein
MTVIEERLFDTVPAAVDHPPSELLIERARAVESSLAKTERYGGYFLRAAYRRQTRAARILLAVPAVLELVVEAPTTMLAVGLNIHIRNRRFMSTLISEYPHKEGERIPSMVLAGYSSPSLIDGSVGQYRAAVLSAAGDVALPNHRDVDPGGFIGPEVGIPELPPTTT